MHSNLLFFTVRYWCKAGIMLASDYCISTVSIACTALVPAKAGVAQDCKLHQVCRTTVQPRVINAEGDLGQ